MTTKKKGTPPKGETATVVETAEAHTDEPADGGGIRELTVDREDGTPAGDPNEQVAVEGQKAGGGKKAKTAKVPKEPKPAKPAKREDLQKGNRICAACGKTEASFLAENDRYSICKGVDVNCYRLGHRVFPDKDGHATLTKEQALVQFPHVKDEDIRRVGGVGIEDGLLVLGATKPPRPPKEKKESKPADTAAASAGATGDAPVEATVTETSSTTTAEAIS